MATLEPQVDRRESAYSHYCRQGRGYEISRRGEGPSPKSTEILPTPNKDEIGSGGTPRVREADGAATDREVNLFWV